MIHAGAVRFLIRKVAADQMNIISPLQTLTHILRPVISSGKLEQQ